ncbi:Putative glycosyltransferase EpsH [Pseudooceanicola marinus]|uniref:Putative glycosyltransferase EpsH n=1 Tax=Pseudooceanicola marinus TaxID=396013 RepID=A0A1X7AA63_9RHOB|nr:glycosyltransferase family A protein [Pseudooceanicola marinus]SLN74321.1 Putative glycosyltransferase EpsH [Pseudooceanicola marinus]
MSDLISIVIPYYNGDIERLEATLDTVRDQSHSPMEILLIDDGSEAEFAARMGEVATRYGARRIRQDNSGPGAARNLGAAEARGDWIAFLDADDIWHPDKLAAQLAHARQPGNGGKVILTRTGTVGVDGTLYKENRYDTFGATEAFVARLLRGGVHSFTSALFMHRDTFAALNGFDRRLRYREDHYFLLRAARERGVSCLPDRLSDRVLHDNSYTAAAKRPAAADLYARQVRFADAVAEIDPAFVSSAFLADEALRIGKQKAGSGDTGQALAMAARAIALRPGSRKGWLLALAAPAARLVPGRFAHWKPQSGLAQTSPVQKVT